MNCDRCDRLNVVPRIISAQDAIEVGDSELARVILSDLEHELTTPVERPYVCGWCGVGFRFPGERDHHERFVHARAAA